ncbi:hypothetical protein C2G38_2081582 [Gigaspora rosea]|uniref:Uncharacterized protein n=1 Tax=Gigaspora rosea TaxID=44941 RepID=A0A397VJT4_9GLOM|nr:hypothetical protein C2G38_2081582 [Gigaspora rosea]
MAMSFVWLDLIFFLNILSFSIISSIRMCILCLVSTCTVYVSSFFISIVHLFLFNDLLFFLHPLYLLRFLFSLIQCIAIS